MVLTKLMYKNPNIDTIVGRQIEEYDIVDAGATGLREIKGETYYQEELMTRKKEDRKIFIGLEQRKDRDLAKLLNAKMLEYLNEFIRLNDIKLSSIIHTTRDSIYLYKKIPKVTKFKHVKFVNKDGIFTSMYTAGRLVIFYDSMRNKLIGKGLSNAIIEESSFLNDYLKHFLRRAEHSQKTGLTNLNKLLFDMRQEYIHSSNMGIYKSLFNENKYLIDMGYEEVFIDGGNDLPGIEVSKDLNYKNIVMPIMRSIRMNG